MQNAQNRKYLDISPVGVSRIFSCAKTTKIVRVTTSQVLASRAVKNYLARRGCPMGTLAKEAGMKPARFYERLRGRSKWTVDELFALADAGVQIPGIDPTFIPAWLEGAQ